uniref:Lipoprotein n=1 Tax=Bursaphelenchus xylophilus TaxID=6326 RepID=A0A1I7RJH9_BURXY
MGWANQRSGWGKPRKIVAASCGVLLAACSNGEYGDAEHGGDACVAGSAGILVVQDQATGEEIRYGGGFESANQGVAGEFWDFYE